MITVALGTNHFVGMPTILGFRQEAVLRVDLDPLRVTLKTPPAMPLRRVVRVADNQRGEGSDEKVRVVTSETSVAVFWDETPLAIATLLNETTVSLRLDLRTIGLNVYEDALGFHVGNILLSTSTFQGNGLGTAISLG